MSDEDREITREKLWEFIRAFEDETGMPVYGCHCGHIGDHDSECEIDLFIEAFVEWRETGKIEANLAKMQLWKQESNQCQ